MRLRSLLSATAVVILAAQAAPYSSPAFAGSPGTLQEATDLRILTTGAPIIGVGDGDQVDVYVVLLKDAPVAVQAAAESGPAAAGRSQGGPGQRGPGQRGKPNLRSENARSHRAQLRGRQDAFVSRGAARLSRTPEVLHTYTEVLNGVAVRVSANEARLLAQDEGVERIIRSEAHAIATYAGPSWIGADGVWEGPAGLQSLGEGTLVGIIDSGVNPLSPSFAATDPTDDYTHVNPFGSGNFVGVCDPAHPNHQPDYGCNDKLVGAYYFLSGHGTFPNQGAFDENGHGSHVASTAAGNRVTIEYNGAEIDVSGVAPRANIINYRVCGGAGTTCFTHDSAAAIDQAVLDGVDALNFSIGGGSNPAADLASQAFLRAAEAGVFVAAAAGNFNPNNAGTVAHRGGWMTTVASTTHNGIIGHPVSVTGPMPIAGAPQGIGGVAGTGPAMTDIGVTKVGTGSQGKGQGQQHGQGQGLDQGKTEYRWSGAVDAANVEGCSPFAAGAFDGAVALISRGTCDFWLKVDHAADAGAVAAVIYNNAGGPPIVMGAQENNTIPSVMVSNEGGQALIDWAGAHDAAYLSIGGTPQATFADGNGDIMALSSGRGPAGNILKPDVAAPGASVLAAYVPDADSYANIGGTSMASPHVAGAGLLLRALHPDWSPLEIKSALMTTGRASGVLKADVVTEADPFDIGGGRVNVDLAANAGLVLHETRANFDATLAGGDLATLNLASFADDACDPTCSWTRTVRDAQGAGGNWSVSVSTSTPALSVSAPTSVAVAAGDTAEFEVSADTSGMNAGDWAFFSVVLSDDAGRYPDQRFRGAVQVPVDLGQGSYIVATNATDATCTMPFANQAGFGGWADFQALGIGINPGIAGDTVGFGWTPPGGPIFLHGQYFSEGVHFRDDGFFVLPHQGQVGVGLPWQNLPIPSVQQPNNMVAPLWHDWQLIANAAQNRGGAIINATLADGAPAFIHDFRRVAQFGSSAVAASFQVAMRHHPSLTPGSWDIVFAYNHLDGSHLSNTTVGVENLAGDQGTQFAFNDANLGHIINGRAICFRWVPD